MKQLVYWLAKHAGVFSLCRWYTRKDLRILAYHGIWLGDGHHYGNFLYMSPDKFKRRMHKLHEMSLPILSLDEALKRRLDGTLPNYATVMTIDDGWYGTYVHMVPELARHNFPATIYLTSYYSAKQVPVISVALHYMFATTPNVTLSLDDLDIDNEEVFDLTKSVQKNEAIQLMLRQMRLLETDDARQTLMRSLGDLLQVSYADIQSRKLFHLMTKEQVQNAAKQGFDIELHTHRHRIENEGSCCIEEELVENRDYIRSLTNNKAKHFCYPSGEYEESVWPHLKKMDVESATTTEAGFVRNTSHRYALPRILDGEDVSDLEFEAELMGFGEVKRRIVSRFKSR
jgi:peptidoglycan/xylan/chitin deacetylase (PgdA/CDA1 family)